MYKTNNTSIWTPIPHLLPLCWVVILIHWRDERRKGGGREREGRERKRLWLVHGFVERQNYVIGQVGPENLNPDGQAVWEVVGEVESGQISMSSRVKRCSCCSEQEWTPAPVLRDIVDRQMDNMPLPWFQTQTGLMLTHREVHQWGHFLRCQGLPTKTLCLLTKATNLINKLCVPEVAGVGVPRWVPPLPWIRLPGLNPGSTTIQLCKSAIHSQSEVFKIMDLLQMAKGWVPALPPISYITLNKLPTS